MTFQLCQLQVTDRRSHKLVVGDSELVKTANKFNTNAKSASTCAMDNYSKVHSSLRLRYGLETGFLVVNLPFSRCIRGNYNNRFFSSQSLRRNVLQSKERGSYVLTTNEPYLCQSINVLPRYYIPFHRFLVKNGDK